MWTMITSLLLAASAAGDVEFHWRGARHPVEPPAEGLSAEAAEALAGWGPWAQEQGLELHLDDDGRVLFVADGPGRGSLELIDRTTAFFDRHLPAPEREDEEQAGGAGAGAGGGGFEPIPEDPESGGIGTSLADALNGGAPKPATSWGATGGALDRDTIVILAIDTSQYAALIEHLVEREPSLAAWAPAARASAGFVLESPPVGAWVSDVIAQEEWDPDGELVHRLTDLLLMRRFGRQPYWVAQGIAWAAEMELRKGIWCYPFRDEFVYTVEHGAWPTDVRNRVKRDFKKESLGIADISGLKRGGWNGQAARMAYATMAWMLEHHHEELVAVLEDLRLTYEQKSRVDLGGGSWERNTAYEVDPAEVERILYEHLGDDVFDELTAGLKTLR